MKSIVLFPTILRIVLIVTIINFAVYANAQSVALNTSGASADASAMLDVSSSSKGFLAPRMTTIQRTGISSPANGLMVFDTDTKTYWYFSTTWKEISYSGSGGFALPFSGSSSNAGKLFSINNNAASSGATALYGRAGLGSGASPIYSMGVWGDNSAGVGVLGTSGHIGVIGQSTDPASGTGVLGSGSNGVYGQSTKDDGAGIYGYAGSISSSQSKAAFFTNTNYANTRPVVEIANYGTGNNNLLIQNTNSSSNAALLKIKNAGTGTFMQLLDETDDVKAAIYDNGSISTDGSIFASGAVVVRGNKGIIRNSNGNQLRIELKEIIIPAYQFQDFGEWVDSQYITYAFSTPFPSKPAVMLTGNIEIIGTGWILTPEISEVTTSGFTVRVTSGNATNTPNKTIKVIILGDE